MRELIRIFAKEVFEYAAFICFMLGFCVACALTESDIRIEAAAAMIAFLTAGFLFAGAAQIIRERGESKYE